MMTTTMRRIGWLHPAHGMAWILSDEAETSRSEP